MRVPFAARTAVVAAICVVLCLNSPAQKSGVKRPAKAAASSWTVRPERVRAHEEFLASDALRGRGSATPEEWIAATYIGSELREFGVEPAADDGSYVQQIELQQKIVTDPPLIKFDAGGTSVTLTYGKDFRIFRLTGESFSGPLKKVDLSKSEVAPSTIAKGSVVLFTSAPPSDRAGQLANWQQALSFIHAGAAAVLLPVEAQTNTQPPELPTVAPRIKALPAAAGQGINVITLPPDSASKLNALADDTLIGFEVKTQEGESKYTYNAMGILRGIDSKLKSQVVLLTAHLDHLGVGRPVNGDNIYNGADDDASGVTAVLELARALAAGPKPKQTVLFVLFGSEERGGFGAIYFREKPPMALANIIANLEFEMIGRADPKVPEGTLWLSGWERSNLGPELAGHGAKLVADPHPEEQFFTRSDNYALALKGVVAQTVSSFGLHSDYHRPSDDIAHLDFKHMTEAIQSMVGPVIWLVNSDFRPEWKPGMKP